MFWLKLGAFGLALGVGIVSLILGKAVGFFVALALVMFAFHNVPETPSFPSINIPLSTFNGLASLALLASLSAALLSGQHNFNFLPLANFLWLAALLTIFLAAWLQDHRTVPSQPSQTHSFKLWHQPYLLLEVGLITLITLLAMGLRVYSLQTFPPTMHGDEGEVGMLALRILSDDPLPLFATTIFGQNPAGIEYLIAPALAIFGQNEVGLRFVPALLGTACIPFIYLTGRRGWGPVAGLAAAWLIAVSHTHIHFSRMALPNMGSALSIILMIWLLFEAKCQNDRIGRRHDQMPSNGESPVVETHPQPQIPLTYFASIGMIIGLSQYIYYGSRLLPLVAGLVLIYLWLSHRVRFWQIVAVGIAALVAVLPITFYYLGNWGNFVGRSGDAFIFTLPNLRHTMGTDATFETHLWPYLRFQAERILNFFINHGDASTFYLRDVAAFDPITVLLFWLGLGVVLIRGHRFFEFTLLVWFFLGLLFAGLLTVDPPHAPRLLAVITCVYLFGGILIHRLWMLTTNFKPTHFRWIWITIAASIAIPTLYLNGQLYFVEQNKYAQNLTPTMVARVLATAPNGYQSYLLGHPILYVNHGTIRFLAGVSDIHDFNPEEKLPLPEPDTKGFLFVAVGERMKELERFQQEYPGGSIESYIDTLGRVIYMAYRVHF